MKYSSLPISWVIDLIDKDSGVELVGSVEVVGTDADTATVSYQVT